MIGSHVSCPAGGRERQRGIVLVLALIFLLLSTLLATGAISQALLQERMAGGQRHAQMAAIAAESALHGAEWRLWKAAAMGELHCGSAPMVDCHVYDPMHPNVWANAFRREPEWVIEGATEYRGSDGRHDFKTLLGIGLNGDARKTAVLAKNPMYLIEQIGPLWPAGAVTTAGADRYVYRITARAIGGDGDDVHVAESVVAVGGD